MIVEQSTQSRLHTRRLRLQPHRDRFHLIGRRARERGFEPWTLTRARARTAIQNPGKSSVFRRFVPVAVGTFRPVPSTRAAVSVRRRRVLNEVDAPERASWKMRSVSAIVSSRSSSHSPFDSLVAPSCVEPAVSSAKSRGSLADVVAVMTPDACISFRYELLPMRNLSSAPLPRCWSC